MRNAAPDANLDAEELDASSSGEPVHDASVDAAPDADDTTRKSSHAVEPASGLDEDWLTRPERGALWGIQFMFRLATLFGRAPASFFVRFIAAWYLVFDRASRDASRAWLSVVFERPATTREIYKHLLTFSQVTLDRIFLLQEKYHHFDITYTGDHHLAALKESQTGALLLGAHLGSFEAMRAGGQRDVLDIHIMGNFSNARMINALFEQLNPDLNTRVIDVGEDALSGTLQAKERIEEGALVGILADRVRDEERSVEVSFFGRPARLPAGPFLIASMMRCPIYLVFGLYEAPNRYDLFCEPFVEELTFARRERMKQVQAVAQKYADAVERYARKSPYCWFNFYDFWEGDGP